MGRALGQSMSQAVKKVNSGPRSTFDQYLDEFFSSEFVEFWRNIWKSCKVFRDFLKYLEESYFLVTKRRMSYKFTE